MDKKNEIFENRLSLLSENYKYFNEFIYEYAKIKKNLWSPTNDKEIMKKIKDLYWEIYKKPISNFSLDKYLSVFLAWVYHGNPNDKYYMTRNAKIIEKDTANEYLLSDLDMKTSNIHIYCPTSIIKTKFIDY